MWSDERTVAEKLEISVIRVTLSRWSAQNEHLSHFFVEEQGEAQSLFRRKEKSHCLGASTIFSFES